MKLSYYSAQTLPKINIRSGSPSITFNKTGVITFNKGSVELIGLKAGLKVSLAQQEESPFSWFVFLDKENGFEVRQSNDKNSIIFSHRLLGIQVTDSFLRDKELSHRFDFDKTPVIVNGDKIKYWRILHPQDSEK